MTLLSVTDLKTTYRVGTAPVHAVDGVSLDIAPGETVGLVGESGCGKSTLGKTILRLVEPSAGRIAFDGVDLTTLPQQRLRAYRRRLQMVFQDPLSSLDPRQSIESLLLEGMQAHGLVKDKQAANTRLRELLQAVGLPAEAVAILLPIDRLLDTVRTAVNVEGDIIGSVVVQRFADRG